MKRALSLFLIFTIVFSLCVAIIPIQSFALPSAHTGTMLSAQTVYCLLGGGMTIGSVSSNETVQVYWRENSYYYIQYVVSSGNYSGYKRGYVPVSSVSVSGVGENTFSPYYGKVQSNKTVYNRSDPSSLVIGSVFASDEFTILQEDGLWYYIDYPISGGGHKRGYIQRSDIIQPQGTLETVSLNRVVGWAWDPVNPDRTIQVHVYIKNNATGEEQGYAVFANIQRSDLGNAGYGNGCHGFECAVNWAGYDPGTYTIRAYAINGVNPQFATTTYTTTNRYASYYMGIREWPASVETEVLNAANQSVTKYQELGLTGTFGGNQPYYNDNGSAWDAYGGLQICTVIAICGHGTIQNTQGQLLNYHALELKRSNGSSDYLFSAGSNGFGGNPYSGSSFATIDDMPIGDMSQADVVAFLSCHSAEAPAGAGAKSMINTVVNKGAKFSLGFVNTVNRYGATRFYLKFLQLLKANNSCKQAFEAAVSAADSNPGYYYYAGTKARYSKRYNI